MLVYFFQFDEGGRRGHSNKLYKRRSRLDTRKYVFANRIIDQWNSLPDACVNSNTLNQFKPHISKILELSRVILDSRLIWLCSLCLLLPPLSFDPGGFGKFGKVRDLGYIPHLTHSPVARRLGALVSACSAPRLWYVYNQTTTTPQSRHTTF